MQCDPNMPQLLENFSINPANILLTLELNDIVIEAYNENHPLRRGNTTDKINIIWDSRKLGSPIAPNSLVFIARKGNRFDSHSLVETVLSSNNIFIGEVAAIEKYLLAEERPTEWIQDILNHPLLIKVVDTEKALQCVLNAATGLKSTDFFSIAVTGTSGKTSAVQILASLLGDISKQDVMRIGTLGIQTNSYHWEGAYPTMPDYIGFVSALTTAKQLHINNLVFEATSHGLIERRMGHWKVDIGIFTNFSQDHLDFHKTMEAYRSCKGILFEEHIKENGFAIINTDDAEWLYFLRRIVATNTNIIGYGTSKNLAAFAVQCGNGFLSASFLEIGNMATSAGGITGKWTFYPDMQKGLSTNYHAPLLGDFHHHNLAAAAAALLGQKYSLLEIAQSAAKIKGIPGRLQLVPLLNAESENIRLDVPTVLVDYAHKPDALEKTLLTLKKLLKDNGKLISVFGCGGDRDRSKRPIMGEISARLADLTIITSDNPRTEDPHVIVEQIFEGIPDQSRVKAEVNRRDAIFSAIATAGPGDIVVIAGKGHEDYQIIGTEKTPFSDFDVAQEALLNKYH